GSNRTLKDSNLGIQDKSSHLFHLYVRFGQTDFFILYHTIFTFAPIGRKELVPYDRSISPIIKCRVEQCVAKSLLFGYRKWNILAFRRRLMSLLVLTHCGVASRRLLRQDTRIFRLLGEANIHNVDLYFFDTA